MKRFLSLLTASLTTLAFAKIAGSNNASYATRGIQTQAVYYRDNTFDQPLIGVKIEIDQSFTSQPFWRISFKLSEGTDPEILSDFKIYKTSVNYFAPSRATELTGGTRTIDGRTLSFDVWQYGTVPQG